MNAAAPIIYGAPYVGGAIQASPGAWAGATPFSYTYQWQRCRRTCARIRGATRPTYTPVAADLEMALRVLVTAANRAGSARAASERTSATGPSNATIRRPLIVALIPSGKTSRLAAIRASGGYRDVFAAPLPGRLTLLWLTVPKKARHQGTQQKKPTPTLVAVGFATIKRPGAVRLKLNLTAAGTRLLRQAQRVKLSGQGTFAVIGRPVVAVVVSFSIVR